MGCRGQTPRETRTRPLTRSEAFPEARPRLTPGVRVRPAARAIRQVLWPARGALASHTMATTPATAAIRSSATKIGCPRMVSAVAPRTANDGRVEISRDLVGGSAGGDAAERVQVVGFIHQREPWR